jgi:hypothetical protein
MPRYPGKPDMQDRAHPLVLIITGVIGLAIGYTLTAPRRGVPAPPPNAATWEGDLRHEFPNRPEGVKDIGVTPEAFMKGLETPAIAADGKGRVLVAFAADTGPLERTIRLARSGDGGRTFEEPKAWRKVPRLNPDPRSAASDVLPRLTAVGDRIALGWVEALEGGAKTTYFVAESGDGGTTFSEPVAVKEPSASILGFTTLAAGPKGELDASWLEGDKAFVASRPAGSLAFGPAVPVFEGSGDAKVSTCSDLALARGPEGPLFATFRETDADRLSIKIARSVSGKFEAPAAVSEKPWNFKGCPRDGPSLTLKGDRLLVAWMDAHDGLNRAYVADSDNASLKFNPRELSPESKGSQWHPKLATDRAGRVRAVWDESIEPAKPADGGAAEFPAPSVQGGRAVRIATATGGLAFGPSRVIDHKDGAYQINPSLATLDDGATLVAWDELDAGDRIVVVVRVAP